MCIKKWQRTFSMIKPDAVSKRVIGSIISRFEVSDLIVVEAKMLRLKPIQAMEFYKEHQGKFFFENLIQFIISGVVFVQVLEGKYAIQRNREIMGSTDPVRALSGTIRSDYGINCIENAIHGSDSEKSANREISYFFGTLHHN